VEHAEVVVEQSVARLEAEAKLVAGVTHEARETCVGPVPGLQRLEWDPVRRERQVARAHAAELLAVELHQRRSQPLVEGLVPAVEDHRHLREQLEVRPVHAPQMERGLLRVGQDAVAPLVRRAQAVEHLVVRRLREEGLAGVKPHRRLHGVGPSRVARAGIARAQIVDAAEAGLHHAQAGRGAEGVDQRLGVHARAAQQGGSVLVDEIERGAHQLSGALEARGLEHAAGNLGIGRRHVLAVERVGVLAQPTERIHRVVSALGLAPLDHEIERVGRERHGRRPQAEGQVCGVEGALARLGMAAAVAELAQPEPVEVGVGRGRRGAAEVDAQIALVELDSRGPAHLRPESRGNPVS
jgi:hypothetical protein